VLVHFFLKKLILTKLEQNNVIGQGKAALEKKNMFSSQLDFQGVCLGLGCTQYMKCSKENRRQQGSFLSIDRWCYLVDRFHSRGMQDLGPVWFH